MPRPRSAPVRPASQPPESCSTRSEACQASDSCPAPSDHGPALPAAVRLGIPSAPSPTDLRFSALAATFESTCGLTENGELHCWGMDGGETPEGIRGDLGFRQVAGLYAHMCAVDVEGTSTTGDRTTGGKSDNRRAEAAPEGTLGLPPRSRRRLPVASKSKAEFRPERLIHLRRGCSQDASRSPAPPGARPERLWGGRSRHSDLLARGRPGPRAHRLRTSGG